MANRHQKTAEVQQDRDENRRLKQEEERQRRRQQKKTGRGALSTAAGLGVFAISAGTLQQQPMLLSEREYEYGSGGGQETSSYIATSSSPSALVGSSRRISSGGASAFRSGSVGFNGVASAVTMTDEGTDVRQYDVQREEKRDAGTDQGYSNDVLNEMPTYSTLSVMDDGSALGSYDTFTATFSTPTKDEVLSENSYDAYSTLTASSATATIDEESTWYSGNTQESINRPAFTVWNKKLSDESSSNNYDTLIADEGKSWDDTSRETVASTATNNGPSFTVWNERLRRDSTPNSNLNAPLNAPSSQRGDGNWALSSRDDVANKETNSGPSFTVWNKKLLHESSRTDTRIALERDSWRESEENARAESDYGPSFTDWNQDLRRKGRADINSNTLTASLSGNELQTGVSGEWHGGDDSSTLGISDILVATVDQQNLLQDGDDGWEMNDDNIAIDSSDILVASADIEAWERGVGGVMTFEADETPSYVVWNDDNFEQEEMQPMYASWELDDRNIAIDSSDILMASADDYEVWERSVGSVMNADVDEAPSYAVWNDDVGDMFNANNPESIEDSDASEESDDFASRLTNLIDDINSAGKKYNSEMLIATLAMDIDISTQDFGEITTGELEARISNLIDDIDQLEENNVNTNILLASSAVNIGESDESMMVGTADLQERSSFPEQVTKLIDDINAADRSSVISSSTSMASEFSRGFVDDAKSRPYYQTEFQEGLSGFSAPLKDARPARRNRPVVFEGAMSRGNWRAKLNDLANAEIPKMKEVAVQMESPSRMFNRGTVIPSNSAVKLTPRVESPYTPPQPSKPIVPPKEVVSTSQESNAPAPTEVAIPPLPTKTVETAPSPPPIFKPADAVTTIKAVTPIEEETVKDVIPADTYGSAIPQFSNGPSFFRGICIGGLAAATSKAFRVGGGTEKVKGSSSDAEGSLPDENVPPSLDPVEPDAVESFEEGTAIPQPYEFSESAIIATATVVDLPPSARTQAASEGYLKSLSDGASSRGTSAGSQSHLSAVAGDSSSPQQSRVIEYRQIPRTTQSPSSDAATTGADRRRVRVFVDRTVETNRGDTISSEPRQYSRGSEIPLQNDGAAIPYTITQAIPAPGREKRRVSVTFDTSVEESRK